MTLCPPLTEDEHQIGLVHPPSLNDRTSTEKPLFTKDLYKLFIWSFLLFSFFFSKQDSTKEKARQQFVEVADFLPQLVERVIE